MKEFWDERYAEEDYAYGEKPNTFFKEELDKLRAGRILLPADGEGRNGVYAATKNWEVHAFDISVMGKRKADKLADSKNVNIEFKVGSLESQTYKENSFDVIALIFAHFPAHLKGSYHKIFAKLLKPGGKIILEAFSKDHLRYNSLNSKVGGPKNVDVLYSKSEIENYFEDFKFDRLSKEEMDLSEGKYHLGIGSVIRFLGTKQ